MKHTTITCDSCKREIGIEEKYQTIELPWCIDMREGKVEKVEYHICNDHDINPIFLSSSSYELFLLRYLNEFIRANRWEVGKEYEVGGWNIDTP